jgi:hypothetical protein
LLVVFATASLLASATAFGAACMPGTLQDYINLGSGGCDLGSVTFADFITAPGLSGGTPIDPAAIGVTPGGTQFAPNLMFNVDSTAGAGEIFQSFFRFAASGALNGASVMLGSPAVSGDGAVTGILDVCPDDFFAGLPTGCPTLPDTAIALATSSDSQLRSGVRFAPSSFFDVFVDITIDGGPTGSAMLDSATVGITVVPEPGSTLLIAAGLGALGLLRVRRNR